MIRFITYTQAEKLPDSGLGGDGGWFEPGNRWEDYLKKWPVNTHIRLESLRQAIIVNYIRCTGYEHQYDRDGIVPMFEDGSVARFSMAGWGDLMAAVWSSEDNKEYSYIDFQG